MAGVCEGGQTIRLADDDTRRSRDSASLVSAIAERYVVGELVGRGGMGEVLAARDRQIGREVAVKRLRSRSASDKTKNRFLREARVQGRLDHPAIVPVYEVGHDNEGAPYFVMKKLAGSTLAELLGLASTSRQRLLRAFVDICLAVEFAHTRGVVHRDIKPTNLILGDFGDVYVIDWGIAKLVGEPDGDFADFVGDDPLSTHAGTALGTPGYMAPEQIRGDAIGIKVDVYALGCVLFAIVTGRPVMLTEETTRDSKLSLTGHRPSTFGAFIAPELDDMIARATAYDPDNRPTARELAERLQHYLDGDRDVMVRRKLAEQHLECARRAFDTDDRTLAMREASAALALDPIVGAAELLGRLMLEPPRTMPAQVEAEMQAESMLTSRSQARIAIYPFLGYFGFTPFLIGYRGTNLWAVLFAAYIAINVWLIRRRADGDVASAWVANPSIVALRMAVLIAVIAHVFSPLVLAPGLAAVTTSALLISPLFWRARDIAILLVLMVSAVALPWLAEETGLTTPTLLITDDGAILHNPQVFGGAVMRTWGWALYAVGLIAAAIAIATYVRRRERESKRRLHLQAWHLRELVQPRAVDHSSSS